MDLSKFLQSESGKLLLSPKMDFWNLPRVDYDYIIQSSPKANIDHNSLVLGTELYNLRHVNERVPPNILNKLAPRSHYSCKISTLFYSNIDSRQEWIRALLLSKEVWIVRIHHITESEGEYSDYIFLQEETGKIFYNSLQLINNIHHIRTFFDKECDDETVSEISKNYTNWIRCLSFYFLTDLGQVAKAHQWASTHDKIYLKRVRL